jgi:hypothetical protein
MPHHYSTFDVTKQLSVRKLTKTQKGSMVAYVMEGPISDQNPSIQLNTPDEPKLVAPFGLTSFEGAEGGRMTLDFSIEHPPLLEKLVSVDQFVIQQAIARKSEFFKENTTDEQVKMMYHPLVHFDNSGKGYAPKVHCKANVQPGAKQINVLQMVGENKFDKAPIELAKNKFNKCMVIVELTNLWFRKQQFGAILLVTDMIIFPQEARPEFNFSWGSQPLPVNVNQVQILKDKVVEREEFKMDEDIEEDTSKPIEGFGNASILLAPAPPQK